MFESCVEIRQHFSDYLDGECDRATFRSVRFHLDYCAACQEEFERFETMLGDLRSLARRRVPEELALQLRVLASRHAHSEVLGRLRLFLDNALKPLLLPASGGVLTAVLMFGLIMGSQIVPVTSYSDEPPQVLTAPPRVEVLPPMTFTNGEDTIVLVTYVDSEGRVISYQVLSGQSSPALLRRLDRMLYQTQFKPALSDGRPTDGKVVLSLRRITVRG